jgi:hypothetical protein
MNNNDNNQIDRDKANIENEFGGEIINIIDDIIEVKDKSGQIHSFKIIGLNIPGEFGELTNVEEIEKLEIGDKVRINIEKGRLTSIQKFIKGN